jgi:hypothetical protein
MREIPIDVVAIAILGLLLLALVFLLQWRLENSRAKKNGTMKVAKKLQILTAAPGQIFQRLLVRWLSSPTAFTLRNLILRFPGKPSVRRSELLPQFGRLCLMNGETLGRKKQSLANRIFH